MIEVKIIKTTMRFIVYRVYSNVQDDKHTHTHTHKSTTVIIYRRLTIYFLSFASFSLTKASFAFSLSVYNLCFRNTLLFIKCISVCLQVPLQ